MHPIKFGLCSTKQTTNEQDLKIDFPDVLKTLTDTPSYKQERKMMAIELQKFELEVEIITSKLQKADEIKKLQISSILPILWNNLHDFQLLAKSVKMLSDENEAVVMSIIDTYYDFLVEHKEYIRRVSLEKRLDLAKMTYEYLLSAQKQRGELLIVMSLMQHEVSGRYKLGEMLEECLNNGSNLIGIIDKGMQLMMNESENLRIIRRQLKALGDGKVNVHTVRGNYPRELSDWLKQSLYRKKQHCFQHLYQYIVYVFLPNIFKNIRWLFKILCCTRFEKKFFSSGTN